MAENDVLDFREVDHETISATTDENKTSGTTGNGYHFSEKDGKECTVLDSSIPITSSKETAEIEFNSLMKFTSSITENNQITSSDLISDCLTSVANSSESEKFVNSESTKENSGDLLVFDNLVNNSDSFMTSAGSSNIHDVNRLSNVEHFPPDKNTEKSEHFLDKDNAKELNSRAEINNKGHPSQNVSVKSKFSNFISAVDDFCDKLSLGHDLSDNSDDIVNEQASDHKSLGNNMTVNSMQQDKISDNNVNILNHNNDSVNLTVSNSTSTVNNNVNNDMTEHLNVTKLLQNTDDLENDLIAELESEFSLGVSPISPTSSTATVSLTNGFNDETSDKSDYELLSSRYNALEQRLKHSNESRRQLELSVIELERKLEMAITAKTNTAKTADDRISQLEFELSESKDMLSMQEEVFKQKELDLKADYLNKLEQVQKQVEDGQRDREGAVLRFAQGEQKNLELQEKLSKAEARLRDFTKEREVALGKWHKMKDEKKTAIDMCEQKVAEINSLKKELETQKELVSSTDVKLKWHQNKLKTEQDLLKDTQTKLTEQNKYVSGAKEEILTVMEQLRTMYKELDTTASHNTSDTQNKKEITANTLEELMAVLKKSVSTLMWKQREVTEELRTYRDKVKCLEVERQSQQDTLSSFKNSLDGQRQGNSDLRDRISELEKYEAQVNLLESQLSAATSKAEELESLNKDLTSDAERNSRLEAEHLLFTEKMSDRLTGLQAENSHLQLQVTTLTEGNDEASKLIQELEQQKFILDEELNKLRQDSTNQITSLNTELQKERQRAATAESLVNDAQNEVKVLKRKCTSIQKDMAKQLAQVARRQECKSSTDGVSLGSRGSCGSLDTVGLTGPSYSREMSPQEEFVVVDRPSTDVTTSNTVMTSQHDSCLEQITHLQKTVTKNKDKISFLQEHTMQLTEEINRKAKIIREYVLREEAGTLTPEASDNAKAQLSRKGGVMASVYSSNNRGGGMNLELSLEINKKLQALLEDTLLKNFQLKEGMDTLGKEIEWLSKQNKQLLQQVKNQNNLVDISDDTSTDDFKL